MPFAWLRRNANLTQNWSQQKKELPKFITTLVTKWKISRLQLDVDHFGTKIIIILQAIGYSGLQWMQSIQDPHWWRWNLDKF